MRGGRMMRRVDRGGDCNAPPETEATGIAPREIEKHEANKDDGNHHRGRRNIRRAPRAHIRPAPVRGVHG